jgi:pimeloyl-ACP methyl ester carboxylesterase
METGENPLFCDIEGHRLAYYRMGKGRTILFLHGITTYSFIWRNIVPFFESDFQVLCLDLLGCGDSDKPLDQSCSIKNHAVILKKFLSQLGIDRIHLVGHDIGGGIGQVFAVNYPEILYDLTLINSVAYDFWPVQPIIAMRTPIIRQMAMATLDLGALRLIVRRGLYHKEKLSPELMTYFWKPMKSKQGRKGFLRFAACLDNQHLLEIEGQLHQLSLPVLIIRGDADCYLSQAISEKLHKNIPNSRLVRIPTGGHFIQEDEPESVAQAIREFIAKR